MRTTTIISPLVAAFNLQQSDSIDGRLLLGNQIGHFGAEVELHLTNDDWTLLVGAPSANNEGVLYKCPVNNLNNCEEINVSSCIDSRTRQNERNAQNKDYFWNFHETGKMLGYTISSSGPDGDVAVCSPRLWLSKSNDKVNTQVGECMILNGELKIKADNECSYSPCLDKKDTTDPALGDYLFCSAGFATSWSPIPLVDDKGEVSAQELLIGLPNSLQYAGNIVSALPHSYLDQILFNVDVQRLTPYTWIYEPPLGLDKEGLNFPESTGLTPNSYLGTTMKTAVLTPGEVTILSGGDHLNEINLYRMEDGGKHITLYATIQPPNLATDVVDISGFGRAIETMDLDGDNQLDIIVGAPLHVFINETDQTSSTEGEVLVYLSRSNSNWRQNGWKEHVTLRGVHASRFGQSIHNIGDVNRDGIDDMAVAAPGENKVYIYNGNRTFSDDTEPVQVLETDDDVVDFGYSITAADFDMNGYSDVVVGSLSESVYLYRSRPIIDVRSTLTPNKNTLKLDDKERSVVIDFCFSFTERSNSTKDNIEINYNITLDLNRHGKPRVSFDSDSSETIFSESIVLSLGKEECVEAKKFYLAKQGQYEDKLSPIDVSLAWDLAKGRSKRAGSAQLTPILDSLDGSSQSIQIMVENNCGKDSICNSNLQAVGEFQMGSKVNGSIEWTSPESTMNRKKKRSLTTFVLGEEEMIGFLVKTQNNREDAHEASFTVRYSKHVVYRGYSQIDDNLVRCYLNEETIDQSDLYASLTCLLGNPFSRNDKAQVRLRFQKQPTIVSQDEITFHLSKNTTSIQKNDDEIEYTMRIKLAPKIKIEATTADSGQFSYRLIPKDQQLNIDEIKETQRSLSEKFLLIGPKVGHRYNIFTESTLTIPKMELEFHWPMEYTPTGGFLLYLMEIDIQKKGKDIQCTNMNIRDPKNIRGAIRRRRQVVDFDQQPIKRFVHPMFTLNDYEVISCNDPGMECEKVVCTITNLRQGENIVFDFVAYAYQPTFSEFLNRITPIDKMVIESDVTVRFDLDGNDPTDFAPDNLDLSTSDMKAAVRITGNSEKAAPSIFTVPLWVIIVAAAGGLLILIIITVILWKMGCFKRGEYKYQPELHRAERKVQRSKEVAENDIYSYDRNVMLLSDQDHS